jgi:hypothetical protein
LLVHYLLGNRVEDQEVDDEQDPAGVGMECGHSYFVRQLWICSKSLTRPTAAPEIIEALSEKVTIVIYISNDFSIAT